MKKTIFLYASVIILAMLVGNVLHPASLFQKENEVNGEGCLPSTIMWSYRSSPSLISSTPLSSPIPPSGKWQFVSDLPIVDVPVTNIVVRTSNEVWVDYTGRGGLWRYNISANEWKDYSISGDFDLKPHLLPQSEMGSDGKLWAFGYLPKTDQQERKNWLSFYNEKTGRFQFVDADVKIINAFNFATDAKQDKKGIFWLRAQKKTQHPAVVFVPGEPSTLFSFDPTTGKFEQHYGFQQPDNFDSNFVAGPDGNIWTNIHNKSVNRYQIMQFIPATNETHFYPDYRKPQDPYLGSFSSLGDGPVYFDRLGHLWVSDKGWIDFSDPNSPVSYNVDHPSLFYSEIAPPESVPSGEPQLYGHSIIWDSNSKLFNRVYQSRDGTYWFKMLRGLVKLNPQTGEWCKVTNGDSVFTEDNKGNMWLVVAGKLFKYSLGQ